MSDTITITKIEAARRQLRTAIELWFHDGDSVSIHTLSASAYQIIHDLNRRKKGPGLLLDSKFIKEEYRKEFVSDIKHASNFMKHADRGRSGIASSLEFRPESNDHFIMFTIIGLKYLGENLGAEEIAFERWHIFRNPDLMTDEGKALFEQTFTVDQLNAVRGTPKRKFLESFRLLLSQPNIAKVYNSHEPHP
ncbi:MAG: hypothetical protein AB1469_03850 [Pseudomonadota bacterium]